MRLLAAFLSLCLTWASVPQAAAQEAARLAAPRAEPAAFAVQPLSSLTPAAAALPGAAGAVDAAPSAPARDNAAILKALASGRPTRLPEEQYVPVLARALAKPRVLWANFSYLRRLGAAVPAAGMTAEFEAALLDAFAYGVPSAEEPDAAFSERTKTFYADRYGGSGIGQNLGSGRAAAAGAVQIKGIGRTPLVENEKDHCNGFVGMEEALREAFWGELNQELPFGANRIIAVIDRGTAGAPKLDGSVEPNALVVREDALRPAHFMALPATDALPWSPPSKNEAAERLAAAFGGGTAPSRAAAISAGLNDYVSRIARQYAAAFARRLFHGAPSESNIELSGRFLDYGTQTALPGHGKLRVLEHLAPSGDIGQIVENQVRNPVKSYLKSLPWKTRLSVPGTWSLSILFETTYREALQREFLSLTGVPPEILDKLETRAEPAADLFIQIAARGAKEISGKYSVPEKITRYDLGSLLTGLASLRSTDSGTIRAFLETNGFAADDNERFLMNRFASAYADVMSAAVSEAGADGVSPDALWTYAALNARNLNRSRAAAYRWKMMDENFASIARYRENGDPGPLQKSIDDRVARSRVVFQTGRPYQVVVDESRDPASGAVRRRIYDARSSRYSSWTGSEEDLAREKIGDADVRQGVERLPALARPKNLAEYRPPRWTGFVRGSTYIASFLLLGTAAIFNVTIAGSAATFLAGLLGLSAAEVVRRIRASRPRPDASAFPPAKQRRLRERLAVFSTTLTRRLGLPSERAPRVVLSNNLGASNAWANGSGIRKKSAMGWGDRWAGLSDKDLAGIMGHELAHLYFEDWGYGLAQPELAETLLIFSATTALASQFLRAILAVHAHAHAALIPFFPFVSILIVMAAIAVAALGARAMERRADHFGGWLTNPRWLAKYFSHMAKTSGKPRRFARFNGLFSTHPPLKSRVEELRRQAAVR